MNMGTTIHFAGFILYMVIYGFQFMHRHYNARRLGGFTKRGAMPRRSRGYGPGRGAERREGTAKTRGTP